MTPKQRCKKFPDLPLQLQLEIQYHRHYTGQFDADPKHLITLRRHPNSARFSDEDSEPPGVFALAMKVTKPNKPWSLTAQARNEDGTIAIGWIQKEHFPLPEFADTGIIHLRTIVGRGQFRACILAPPDFLFTR